MKWIEFSERKPKSGAYIAVKLFRKNDVFVFSDGWMDDDTLTIDKQYEGQKFQSIQWLDESEEPVFTKNEVLALVKDMIQEVRSENHCYCNYPGRAL